MYRVRRPLRRRGRRGDRPAGRDDEPVRAHRPDSDRTDCGPRDFRASSPHRRHPDRHRPQQHRDERREALRRDLRRVDLPALGLVAGRRGLRAAVRGATRPLFEELFTKVAPAVRQADDHPDHHKYNDWIGWQPANLTPRQQQRTTVQHDVWNDLCEVAEAHDMIAPTSTTPSTARTAARRPATCWPATTPTLRDGQRGHRQVLIATASLRSPDAAQPQPRPAPVSVDLRAISVGDRAR